MLKKDRINAKGAQRRIEAHSERAQRAVEANAEAASRILEDSDLKTTMRYVHPDDSLIDAVEKLGNFTQERSNEEMEQRPYILTLEMIGGDDGNRTRDLCVAKANFLVLQRQTLVSKS